MGEGTDPGGAAVQKMGQNDEEDEGGERVLHTIPIIDSINYVYGKSGHYIPFLDTFNIALEMAVQRAYSAATRPEDSPNGWKEAMA